MPKFETRHPVRHTARQMYDLVADVEAYPQFLPLCESLKVTFRSADTLVADMHVGYGPIREKFTSKVSLDGAALRIQSEYLDGPFKHMTNRWIFVDTKPGCSEVHFYIDYEFKSFALQMLMGSMFELAFRKFTTAFEERARQVYGVV